MHPNNSITDDDSNNNNNNNKRAHRPTKQHMTGRATQSDVRQANPVQKHPTWAGLPFALIPSPPPSTKPTPPQLTHPSIYTIP